MFSSSNSKVLFSIAIAVLLSAGLATIAVSKMRSERIDRHLCKTTGGGRFVDIPGFPGEKIDRRLKRDVKRLVRRYKIHVTDGYSLDPVHSANGEHPIGLALDIVPDTSRGGRWRHINKLARWAEPRQNQPRAPFRWVGYNGDPGHGRGHHLHLSWAHSETRYNKPARTVYSIRCPRRRGGKTDPKPGDNQKPPSEQQPQQKTPDNGTGGISPTRHHSKPSGGIRASKLKRKIRRQQRSGTSRERGGIDAR